jgi:hemerythrin
MKNILYISWTDKNNTGIKIIDEQHKGIVSLINTLHFSMIDIDSFDILEPIIKTISEYTKLHFITEEELLKQTKYPDSESHVQLHRNLQSKTTIVSKEAAEQNDPAILLKFLKEWWLDHICKEDSKYINFVSDHFST